MLAGHGEEGAGPENQESRDPPLPLPGQILPGNCGGRNHPKQHFNPLLWTSKLYKLAIKIDRLSYIFVD